MNQHKGALFILFFFFGIVLVLQFRSILDSTQDQNAVNAAVLQTQLTGEQSKAEGLRAELAHLETEREKLLEGITNTTGGKESEDLLQTRSDMLLRAGLSSVSGKGIVLTLNDAKLPGDFEVEDTIIHDSDIYTLLNELRMGGAQAMTINGERILGTSKTVCAGPTILINDTRYPVPFEIQVIGDPKMLMQTMDNSEAIAIMRVYGIRAEYHVAEKLELDRFHTYNNLDDLLSGLEEVEK